ncbi:hypothetical protein ACEPPN_012157 [Leptodophora sp. 'Broadleaf-Isolate-01']
MSQKAHPNGCKESVPTKAIGQKDLDATYVDGLAVRVILFNPTTNYFALIHITKATTTSFLAAVLKLTKDVVS